MNKLIISEVINTNISCVFKNAICFYFWDGKECNDTIKSAINRYSFDICCFKDINNIQIKELFNKWIDKSKKDCSFIYLDDIKASVIPKLKNFKDFCDEYHLPFKNVSDMQNFIIQNF